MILKHLLQSCLLYTSQLFTEEGIVFASENKELDLLNGDTNDIWVEDSEGNSINIEFSADNAISVSYTHLCSQYL